MNINDLTTQDGFSAFLHAYHQRLHAERSFPPLGVQKALHTASPIFGYENWQGLSASNTWNSPQTPNESNDAVALLIEYREDYAPFSDDLGFIEETDFKLFESASDACSYLHHLINLRDPLTLTGQQGREAEAATAETSDYDLDKWAEFATFHLKATIQVKRQSSPDPKVEVAKLSESPDPVTEGVIELSFTVDYEGDHQSPHQTSYSTRGTKSEVNEFFASLISEDVGAIDNITYHLTDRSLSIVTHPLKRTELFQYLKRTLKDCSEEMVSTAIHRIAKHSSFGISSFIALFEVAAGVSISNQKMKMVGYSTPHGEYPLGSDVADVVSKHLDMQEQYGFNVDEDSVRSSVIECANMLNIQLNDIEIEQACDRILSQ